MLEKLKIEAISEKAVQTYGAAHQQAKAIEELGELIQALAKHMVGDPNNAPEEIADVEIMLAQLRHMFPQKEIDTIKETKLKRLSELVW